MSLKSYTKNVFAKMSRSSSCARLHVLRNSFVCSALLWVVKPSSLCKGGTLSCTPLFADLRHFAACQILVLSDRTSFQWAFFCFRIVAWYF